MRLILLLIFLNPSFVLADYRTNSVGQVTCGAGRCLTNNIGEIVCTKVQGAECGRNSIGEIICSDKPFGGCANDSLGTVVCQ